MTEQTPPLAPDSTTDPSAELAQLRADVDAATARAEAAERAAADAGAKEPRYAVYDKTFLKYLPGVHAKRTDAEKAAKAAGIKYRIDEV